MNRTKTPHCKYCKQAFTPARPDAVLCSAECAIAMAEKQIAKAEAHLAKAERKAIKARILELKPIQYFLKRTEKAVNALARLRDEDEPCISCGTWDAQEWHAGHFIPVGRAKSIRFDLANINKQCNACNVHGNGKATDYEIRLTPKIGKSEVERLKTAPKEKKWTREELQALELDAKTQAKELIEQRRMAA